MLQSEVLMLQIVLLATVKMVVFVLKEAVVHTIVIVHLNILVSCVKVNCV